jgi:hypothetical protein
LDGLALLKVYHVLLTRVEIMPYADKETGLEKRIASVIIHLLLEITANIPTHAITVHKIGVNMGDTAV